MDHHFTLHGIFIIRIAAAGRKDFDRIEMPFFYSKRRKKNVGKNLIGIFSNVHFISKMRHMQSHTGSMH